jgi:N-acetylmuramoyl-L-alanine amidase
MSEAGSSGNRAAKGGPCGQGEYVVQPGDCVDSIAEKHGLCWETVWDHPDNSVLKAERKGPNLLLPGDRLTVPEKSRGEESGSTEERHRFRRLGVPAILRLRFLKEEGEEIEEDADGTSGSFSSDDLHAVSEDPDPDEQKVEEEPRANVPYRLEVDGIVSEGETDDEGRVEVTIPPDARGGKITLEPATEREAVFELKLGHLDPIEEPSGVKQRLNNLGIFCADASNEATPELEAAVREFQEKHGLEVTGEVDDATRDELEELHES